MLILISLAIAKLLNEQKMFPSSATCMKWLLRTKLKQKKASSSLSEQKAAFKMALLFSVAVYATSNSFHLSSQHFQYQYSL